MAETKKLKSIKFPGLEDTYTIPQKLSDLEQDIDTGTLKAGSGVDSMIPATTQGATGTGDEKDPTPIASGHSAVALGRYTRAIGDESMAIGYATLSGVKGYNMISVDALTITVNDANLEEKASVVYAVGDILQFDASQHYYNRLKITRLSTNDKGQTIITVEDSIPTATAVNLALDSDPNENYVWVVGKNYGEVFPMAYGSHAEGELTKAMGRAAHAEGRESQAIGNYGHAEGRATIANYLAHAEGLSTKAIGGQSHAEGNNSEAIGSNSHAEGQLTQAIGADSHAEGFKTKAEFRAHSEGAETQAFGTYSHTEGFQTFAEAEAAHAEGRATQALGAYSHAEGSKTITVRTAAHAEGTDTEAYGTASHAEGANTRAQGDYSHAEGQGTIARAIGSHVQGKYNIEDTGLKFAHIVGGGTSDTDRKNIHTVDWSGNAWYAGKITVGIEPTDDMDVATKKYVDSLCGGEGGSIAISGASVGQIAQIAAVDENGVPTEWAPVDMPSGDKWELIEKVTLTEAVSSVEMTFKNFAAKKLVYSITAPNNPNIKLNVYSSSAGGIAKIAYFSSLQAITYGYIENTGGLRTVWYGTQKTDNITNPGDYDYGYFGGQSTATANFTYFWCTTFSEETIPEGTTITIYGVRA